jgi:hypothetical protein
MNFEKDTAIECEKCKTFVYFRRAGKRRIYFNWEEDSTQTGMSKKYSGEYAGYCKKHRPK